MKVMATIEARMGASRLPGKVLLCLAGKPMLARKIERVKRCTSVDDIMVLTTIDPMNEIIADFCHREKCRVFRGSENDILNRIIQGTADDSPDIIVQLTGDNPLIDPALIDEAVWFLIDNDLDLVSNSLTQSVIIGMNVRCFRRDALLKADKLCDDPLIRVHGGYYIQMNPDKFKIAEVPVKPRYLRDDIRLTVDEPADFELVRIVYERLLEQNPDFTIDDIVDLFDNEPELKVVNQNIRQKRVGEG